MDEDSRTAKVIEELVLCKFATKIQSLPRTNRNRPSTGSSGTGIVTDIDSDQLKSGGSGEPSIGTEDVSVSVSNYNEENNSSGVDYKIAQLVKACYFDELTRNKDDFYSEARLEAEKLLCLMHYKRYLAQTREDFEDELNPNIGTISVKNIKLKTENQDCISKQYFFCLVKHADAFYTSSVSEMDSNGIVDVAGDFKFNNVSADFELIVIIYSLNYKIGSNINCFLDYDRPPKFRACSQISIKAVNLLEPEDDNYSAIDDNGGDCEVTADVVLRACLDFDLAGFLDFSAETGRCLLWEKTYVTLKKTTLTVFKHPQTARPFKVFDLKTCVWIAVADKLLKRRALFLEFERRGRVFACFLAAENKGDFECWRKYLETVVVLVEKWKRIGIDL